MPLYEYECSGGCGVVEVLQKMDEPALEKCPKCGHECKKIMSKNKFVLCGAGWAADGYQKRKC